MATALRPMSGGEILDRAFQIYRRHFVTLFGIAVVAQIPGLLVTLAVYGAPAPQAPVAVPGGVPPWLAALASMQRTTDPSLTLLASLVGLVMFLLGYAASAVAVSQAYLGEGPTIGGAYRRALRGLGHLLIAALVAGLALIAAVLVGAVIMGIAVAGAFLGAMQGGGGAAVGTGLVLVLVGVIAMIVPAAVLAVWWFFSPQAVVLEGQPGPESLGRSRRLVGGSWWRVFGILLLAYLLVAFLELGLAVALGGGIVAAVLGIRSTFSGAVPLVTAAVVALITPLQYGIATLLYFDLRVRKEGFDLQQMAAQAQSAS